MFLRLVREVRITCASGEPFPCAHFAWAKATRARRRMCRFPFGKPGGRRRISIAVLTPLVRASVASLFRSTFTHRGECELGLRAVRGGSTMLWSRALRSNGCSCFLLKAGQDRPRLHPVGAPRRIHLVPTR